MYMHLKFKYCKRKHYIWLCILFSGLGKMRLPLKLCLYHIQENANSNPRQLIQNLILPNIVHNMFMVHKITSACTSSYFLPLMPLWVHAISHQARRWPWWASSCCRAQCQRSPLSRRVTSRCGSPCPAPPGVADPPDTWSPVHRGCPATTPWCTTSCLSGKGRERNKDWT